MGKNPSQIAKSLHKAAIFADLDSSQVASIAALARVKNFKKDCAIIRQGQPGDAFYYLAGGKVDVLVRDYDGDEKKVAVIGKNDYFGEMSLLTGEKCSATIVTAVSCKTICIKKADFDRLLQENSTLYQHFTQVLCRRLDHITKGLERQIKERTAELRTVNNSLTEIMSNIRQSIITIDRDFNIGPQYSARSATIYGKRLQAGMSYVELVAVDAAAKKAWTKWLSLSFEIGVLDWDELLELVPARSLTYGEKPGSKTKQLELDILPIDTMEEGRQKRKALMIITTDVTREKRLQSQMEEESKRSVMLLTLIQNRRLFENFYRESREGLEEAQSILNAKKVSGKAIDAVFRAVHSLKSSAGSLNIYAVTEKAHQLEDELDVCRKKGKLQAREKLGRDLARLKKNLEAIRKEFIALTGPQLDTKRKRIEDWEIKAIKKARSLEAVNVVVDSLDNPSLFAYLSSKAQTVFNKGMEITGKKAKLKLEIEKCRVPQELLKSLEIIIPHLLNNALGHGIETPEDRLSSGKPPAGRIMLRAGINKQDKALTIELSDDGKGIDGKAIAAKAVENGLITAAAAKALKPPERQELIFLPGLSSSETVSRLSGRGVGVDAVKRRVERGGGSIAVASVPSEGTTFSLVLPLSS